MRHHLTCFFKVKIATPYVGVSNAAKETIIGQQIEYGLLAGSALLFIGHLIGYGND